MVSSTASELNGIEKGAILLMTLGASASAEIFKLLTEEEIEALASAMVQIHHVDPSLAEAVLTEFQQSNTQPAGVSGGMELLTEALGQALGPEKAGQVIQNAGSSKETASFQGFRDADPGQVAALLGGEHPQVIAMVLRSIPVQHAAAVFSRLDEGIQVDIATRITNTEIVDPGVLSEIEQAMKMSLTSEVAAQESSTGTDALADILSSAQRSTEQRVIEAINSANPDLGSEVHGKMFLFEDIVRLSDRSVQRLLRELDHEVLRMAIKQAGDEIKELVFRNMSERAAESMKEDLELLDNPRASEMEEAQQTAAEVCRRLLASGEIALAEPTEETQTETPQDGEPDKG